MREDFGTVYTKEFGVPREQIANSLLCRCCHEWARPLLKLVLLVNPVTFFQELQHLESLKGTINRNEFRQEVRILESFTRHHLPAWRRTLQLRISITKLSQISRILKTDKPTFDEWYGTLGSNNRRIIPRIAPLQWRKAIAILETLSCSQPDTTNV